MCAARIYFGPSIAGCNDKIGRIVVQLEEIDTNGKHKIGLTFSSNFEKPILKRRICSVSSSTGMMSCLKRSSPSARLNGADSVGGGGDGGGGGWFMSASASSLAMRSGSMCSVFWSSGSTRASGGDGGGGTDSSRSPPLLALLLLAKSVSVEWRALFARAE